MILIFQISAFHAPRPGPVTGGLRCQCGSRKQCYDNQRHKKAAKYSFNTHFSNPHFLFIHLKFRKGKKRISPHRKLMRRSRLIGADAEPRSASHSRKRLKKGKAFSYEPSHRSSIVCNFILYPIYFSVKTFIYFCDLRHLSTCAFVHFASRAKNMTYDLLCISKAYSMTFRKNQRYSTTPGGTACGRAGLRCVRRQAAVYADLRRAQAADIVGHDLRRARRNLRAYVRANGATMRRHAYTQIPKAGEASRRRRAAVRRRAYTQMPPSVHDCGRRSTVRTHSVRNQALSASSLSVSQACGGAKGGAVSQSCAHK